MLAAKYLLLGSARKIKALNQLRDAAIISNARKRGAARVGERIDLDTIPDEAWRSQFRLNFTLTIKLTRKSVFTNSFQMQVYTV
jgi:hypothetical protein